MRKIHLHCILSKKTVKRLSKEITCIDLQRRNEKFRLSRLHKISFTEKTRASHHHTHRHEFVTLDDKKVHHHNLFIYLFYEL